MRLIEAPESNKALHLKPANDMVTTGSESKFLELVKVITSFGFVVTPVGFSGAHGVSFAPPLTRLNDCFDNCFA